MTIELTQNDAAIPQGPSRRSFLQWSALLGGATALGACSTAKANTESGADGTSETKVYRTANTPECLHCAMLVHVEDGEVRKVTADPDFHIKACGRGLSRINQLKSPHRLKYPMKRTGERGSNAWERISWDEALDTIADKMRTIKEEDGNKAFVGAGGTGNWSTLSTGVNGLWGGFWNRFGGSTPLIASLCCQSVTESYNSMFGGNRSEFRDEWVHTKYFIAWGNNPAVSNQGYFKNIIEAREKNGARLVTIDPRLSETAAMSDAWIQIRPGTDAALSLGMIKVILDEELADYEYMKAYTNAPFLVRYGDKGIDLEAEAPTWEPGEKLPIDLTKLELMQDPPAEEDGSPTFYMWDEEAGREVAAGSDVNPQLEGQFEIDGVKYQTVHSWMRAIANRFTPEVVQKITGVEPTDMLTLSRQFASAKPAAIIQNMSGAQRTDNGTLTILGQLYLAVITGNVGTLGGGINDTGGVMQYVPIDFPVPLQENPDIEGIPSTKLGEAILEEKPHKIRMMYIAGTGILTQYPDTNSLIEAFKKLEFIVVQDQFMTTTAKYADIVLPVTTIFETTNVIAGKRNRYIQLMEQAIEPMYESRSDHWILAQLANRLGFGADFDKPAEDLIRHALAPSGVTYEDILEGPVNPLPDPWIPFENKEFDTPSGRIEFFSTYLKDKGFEPILEYRDLVEAPWVDKGRAKDYPLQLINRRNHNIVNSSFVHHDLMKEIWPGQVVQLNPEDAEPRGISTGDMTIVFNDRGEVEAKAIVTPGILAGVVSLTTGFGVTDEKQTASKLTPNKYERISKGHTLNSSTVNVRLQDGVSA